MKLAKVLAELVLLFAGLSACSLVNSSSLTVASTPSQSSIAYPPMEQNTEKYLGYPTNPNEQVRGGLNIVPPEDAPEPLKGSGSVSGLLYSFTTQLVLKENPFYLTPVSDEGNFSPVLVGPQPEKGDIVGITDSEGKFYLDNVKPGKYILVVQSPYDWLVAILSPDSSAKPRVIEIKENQKQVLGVLYVGGP
jgi:hypothetical protein